jgi:hypothetical protein
LKHSFLFFSLLSALYTRDWNCFWNIDTSVSLTCCSFSSVWWLKEKNTLSVLESLKCLVMKCKILFTVLYLSIYSSNIWYWIFFRFSRTINKGVAIDNIHYLNGTIQKKPIV